VKPAEREAVVEEDQAGQQKAQKADGVGVWVELSPKGAPRALNDRETWNARGRTT
jgi:hypothetical protein